MASSTARKVVVFAGAGASKAVDPKAYPTTVEFFERLPDSIKQTSLFANVVEFLQDGDFSRIIDIEEVLWAFSELRDFLKEVQKGKGLLGHFLKGHKLAKIFSHSYDFGHIDSVAGTGIPALNSIISDIHARVFDFYIDSPSNSRLAGTWLPLLKPLIAADAKVDVFTTNYDVVLESALEGILKQNTGSYFGLAGSHHKTLDLSQWQAKTDSKGLFTKLHGSVDWKIQGSKIFVGDPVFTGDHQKQGIIYPGFKGIDSGVFFKPFHDYLERCLSEATFVAFIGFAFRDEYINNSIRNNLNGEAEVWINNPDIGVKFPYRRAKVKYLPRGFDLISVSQLAKAALFEPPTPKIKLV